MALELVSFSKCFGGEQRVFRHESSTLGCKMTFSIFLPPSLTDMGIPCPVLYFLSGLTCTHENFMIKSGVQRYASEYCLAIVAPDTSPRGLNIEGENDSDDFGTGASFYIDATQEPWSKNYKMFSYVTKELIELVQANFFVLTLKRGIFGHSMGGHGALICALKNPGLYTSVSAFSPIANPVACSWGQKAFKGYLGDNQEAWKEWDATCLSKKYTGVPQDLFLDQGSEDEFLKQKQLLPENLLAAVSKNERLQTIYHLRKGYDHSYYYVASFIGQHIKYHASLLTCKRRPN